MNHLGGYSVAGYGFILKGSAGTNNIHQYPADTIKPEVIKNNHMTMSAGRPMVVDLIMAQDNVNGKYGLEFGRITSGGLWKNHHIYDTTSHLIRDVWTAGGNIGFLDGHIEWQMEFPGLSPRRRQRQTFT